jgi:hypothetical protein
MWARQAQIENDAGIRFDGEMMAVVTPTTRPKGFGQFADEP